MTFTGLYKQSLKERRKQAQADVKKVADSLAALANHDSAYAQEHRALLELLERVAAIYVNAPAELTPDLVYKKNPAKVSFDMSPNAAPSPPPTAPE